MKITWHSNTLGLQGLLEELNAKDLLLLTFQEFSIGSKYCQIVLQKGESVASAASGGAQACGEHYPDVFPRTLQLYPLFCLDLFLGTQDKPQEFLQRNRY